MSDNQQANFDIVRQFLNWGIFPDPGTIADSVSALKKKNPNATDEELIARMCGSAKKLAAAQGVVASLPGAIPVFGTAAQIGIAVGTAAPESILLFRKMAHLQMSIAYLYGCKIYDELDNSKLHEDRIEEFVTVLGIMTGVILPAKEAAKRFGSRFAAFQISRRVSGRVLREINKKIGFTLLTKFGTKRGGIALGRIIPLGIGAGIGGAMNYASISHFSKVASKYYKDSDEVYYIEE